MSNLLTHLDSPINRDDFPSVREVRGINNNSSREDADDENEADDHASIVAEKDAIAPNSSFKSNNNYDGDIMKHRHHCHNHHHLHGFHHGHQQQDDRRRSCSAIVVPSTQALSTLNARSLSMSSSSCSCSPVSGITSTYQGVSLLEEDDRSTHLMNDSTISFLNVGSPDSDFHLASHRRQQQNGGFHTPRTPQLKCQFHNSDNSFLSPEANAASHSAGHETKTSTRHYPSSSFSARSSSPAHSCPSEVDYLSRFQRLTIQCNTPEKYSGNKAEKGDAHDVEGSKVEPCPALDVSKDDEGIFDMLTIRHSNTKDEDEDDQDKDYILEDCTEKRQWWNDRIGNSDGEENEKPSDHKTIGKSKEECKDEEGCLAENDRSFQLSLSDHDNENEENIGDEYEYRHSNKGISESAGAKVNCWEGHGAEKDIHLTKTHQEPRSFPLYIANETADYKEIEDLKQEENPDERSPDKKEDNADENNITFGHCVNLDLDMEGAIEMEVLATASTSNIEHKRTSKSPTSSTPTASPGNQPEVSKSNSLMSNKDANDLILSPSWSSQPTSSSNTSSWNGHAISAPVYFKRSLTLPELGNNSRNNNNLLSNVEDVDDDGDDIYYNLSSWSISHEGTSINGEDDESIDSGEGPDKKDTKDASHEDPTNFSKGEKIETEDDVENTTTSKTLGKKEVAPPSSARQESIDETQMDKTDVVQATIGKLPKLFVFDDNVKGRSEVSKVYQDQKCIPSKINPPTKLMHITSSTDESSAARISSKTSSNCSAQTSSPFSFLRGQEINVSNQTDQSTLYENSIHVASSTLSDREESTGGIPKSTLLTSSSSSSGKMSTPYDETKERPLSPDETVSYRWEFYGDSIVTSDASFGESRIALNHSLSCMMMVKRYDLHSSALKSDSRYEDNMDGLDCHVTEPRPPSPRRALVKELTREIEIMRSLNHVNIVRFLGSEATVQEENQNQERGDVPFFIFQELVPGYDCTLTKLVKNFGALSTPTMRSYLIQLLQGLSFLHQHHIVHCDLKGDNLLICQKGILKISDFGLARHLLSHDQGHSSYLSINHQSLIDADASTSPMSCISSSSSIDFEVRKEADTKQDSPLPDKEHSSISTTSGPIPFFVAPEVFTGQFGRKCDIWSVGCVLYQMITASHPWENLDFYSAFALFLHLKRTTGCPPPFVTTDEGRHTAAVPSTITKSLNNHHSSTQCHSELRTLMEFCFQRNPQDRPSARRLLRTEFLSLSRKQGESEQPPVERTTAKNKQQEVSILPHQQLRMNRKQSTASTPIRLSALPRVSSFVNSAKEKVSLLGLSPNIFTDSGVERGLAKHESRDFPTGGSKPITPRSAPRLTHTSATASNVRRLPPTSAKKETNKRILLLGTPLKQTKESTTTRNIPPSGRKLRSLASYHGFEGSNHFALGAATLSDDMSCSKDSTATFGNKSTTHHSVNNIPGQQHEKSKTFVMFDLTYSNSNESEDLPISIHPLDNDVTSPLSNCSSTGENSSVGHCSIASQVISDHWPSWAKQRKEELDKTKQRGRAFVANAASSLNNIRQQNPFEKKITAGAINEFIASKGNIPRPAPRAPTTEPRKKKMNPFARKSQ